MTPDAARSEPATAAEGGSHESAAELGPRGGAPVVVAIVVDQLAAWVASERLPRLPPGGGFARLRREGTWVKDLTYLHSGTDTAMGHSALFSGCIPRETGIVGNSVLRSDLDPPREGSLLEDPDYRIVGPSGVVLTADGRRPKNGISLARMTPDSMPQPLLADRLVARDPRAVVVALSLKDRGAAFGGGHRPTAMLWFDDDAATLVTSRIAAETVSASIDALPTWARPFERPSELDHGVWKLLDPAFIADNLDGIPDDQRGEMPDIGGRVFPHSIGGPGFGKRFRATPAADALLADLGLAAVARARDPEHPMLLTLSFSTNDYVGHAFGPNSWEAWDELEQLDATLDRFLRGLDALVGSDGYAIVLSGDHGIVPFPLPSRPAWCAPGAPNPYEKPCALAGRLNSEELKRYLNDRLTARLGRSNVVRAVVESLIYLSPEALSLPATQRRQLDATLRAELIAMDVDGQRPVRDVFMTAAFRAGCPAAADETIPALVCRTTSQQRDGGDAYVVPRPGAFFWFRANAVEGASHGTPYRYDRTVPLLVRYPRGAAQKVVDRAMFGSYYASAWYGLTGEAKDGPYGGAVGMP
ncbi:MAG TPA: alkaline phosphatase family protein [Polyangiaceae bacterium]|nr:alkaline phosphatase family protein [Polyangiaceae bacterium]